jgi:hypothetical protein
LGRRRIAFSRDEKCSRSVYFRCAPSAARRRTSGELSGPASAIASMTASRAPPTPLSSTARMISSRESKW